ncbi:hypothetical protein KEM48_008963 [Puccinia striiformis f. sp. tritici PST-130]|nr:hypothetical protein KEM48_008963 [Puccinia striiformis f. sp. tritici PST-130]
MDDGMSERPMLIWGGDSEYVMLSTDLIVFLELEMKREIMMEILESPHRYEDNPDTDGTTAFNISKLEAMHMARAAWASVTQKMIANWWKHTGILRHPNNTNNISTKPLNQNNPIASDEDLESIVRETKDSLHHGRTF